VLGGAPALLGAGAPLLPRRLGPHGLTLESVDHDERFVFLTYRVTSPGGDHGRIVSFSSSIA
jgi:hypothetical protein